MPMIPIYSEFDVSPLGYIRQMEAAYTRDGRPRWAVFNAQRQFLNTAATREAATRAVALENFGPAGKLLNLREGAHVAG